MKKFLIVIGLVVLLGLYVLYTFVSTGYFRKIADSTAAKVVDKIMLPGVEDIAISYQDKFLILSSDDRAARRDALQAKQTNTKQGGLYFVDLTQPTLEPKLLTENIGRAFNPHGISLMRLDSSRYKLWVINHVDGIHSIETFYLYGDSLVADEIIKAVELISPNDIVGASEFTFYVTNDHGSTSKLGRLGEDYLGIAKANVVFYDGSKFRRVIDGVAYANGINIDFKRSHLYVASARGFNVLVYNLLENGNLAFIKEIDAATGVDNIEIDPSGTLWIGCHPNLLWFAAYAAGKKPTSPSEIIKITPTATEYTIESIYTENGQNVSASSVAIPFENKIFVGNVMDEHVLVIELDGAQQ